ncbi:MAG: hypothetical protein JWN00_3422, partial [Actinomycetia bacterium]|nr:hypothetical protein [Actinomycetes bacterium]
SRHGERPGDPPARSTGGRTAQRRTCPGPDDPSATGLDSPAPTATATATATSASASAVRLGPARRPGVPWAAQPGPASGLRYAIARKVPCTRSWRTASEPVRDIRRFWARCPSGGRRAATAIRTDVGWGGRRGAGRLSAGVLAAPFFGAYGSWVGAGQIPVGGRADPQQHTRPYLDQGPSAGAFGAVVVTT